MESNPPFVLDPSTVLKYLQEGGPLSQLIPTYESRQEQQEMLLSVIDAYHQNSITLIEAGTGTGKSLAYLLPAVLWALKKKEKTLISTNTINLQEQLIHKDIPLVRKILGLDFKAVLVKGMSNYVCLRKLEDAKNEINLLPGEDSLAIQKIAIWSEKTHDGSRSSLGFLPEAGTWEKVHAETDMCSGKDCPFYDRCFFFKARESAKSAHLLIANHHLTFADLASKTDQESNEGGVLPNYQRIIFDEAHNIEDVATEFFADKVSNLGLMHILSRLANEKQGYASGKLPLLKKLLTDFYGVDTPSEISRLIGRLSIDIPTLRWDLMQHLIDCFQKLNEFSKQEKRLFQKESDDHSLRLTDEHFQSAFWKEVVTNAIKKFLQSSQNYIQEILGIDQVIRGLNSEKLDEKTKNVRQEINALLSRFSESIGIISRYLRDELPTNCVRWMESQLKGKNFALELVDAKLDISEHLIDALFLPHKSVILTSATLTTDNQFDFMKTRLGLDQLKGRAISEHIYKSPFNYKKQAVLFVPTDIPDPSRVEFQDALIFQIASCIRASSGNAFVLFTSYQLLDYCYKELLEPLQKEGFHLLRQGDDSRSALIKRFKETEASVLFGTDSFWEGVDVVGDALRCVIITKLPFKPPSEPIIQARSEAIAKAGGNPFMEYSLPQAIVKFKQGFGRLIRTKNDRGCVVCLDTRLAIKPYGKLFINSLPDCTKVYSYTSKVYQEMKEFYSKKNR